MILGLEMVCPEWYVRSWGLESWEARVPVRSSTAPEVDVAVVGGTIEKGPSREHRRRGASFWISGLIKSMFRDIALPVPGLTQVNGNKIII